MAKTHGVLRIGEEDCAPEQTLGMLEWVRFLNEQGAPVTAPVTSIHGRLLERLEQDGKTYTITAFEEAEGILAERIPLSEWSNELFQAIGQAAGKLHAVSKRYQPPSSSLTRPEWFESSEIHDVQERLANRPDPAGVRLAALVGELKRLPASPENYGLIHDDLHFANFLVQPGGEVMIIDFDDCCYGWYAMDVAMALFDVLVLYRRDNEEQRCEFARHFLRSYLSGYRQENSLEPYWVEQIPRFLKLKEMCVYVPLIGHAESATPGTWVGEFMPGRAERIANDVPYVDIDFSNL